MMRRRVRGRTGSGRRRARAVVPLLLTILYVVFQFGQVYLQYQEVSAATSEGARPASRWRPSPTRAHVHDRRNGAGGNVGRHDAAFDSQRARGRRHQHLGTGKPGHRHVSYPASVSILGVTLFSGQPHDTAHDAGAQLTEPLRTRRRRERARRWSSACWCSRAPRASRVSWSTVATPSCSAATSRVSRTQPQWPRSRTSPAARAPPTRAHAATRRRRTAPTDRSSTRSSSPGTRAAPATADSVASRSRPRASAWSCIRTPTARSASSWESTSGTSGPARSRRSRRSRQSAVGCRSACARGPSPTPRRPSSRSRPATAPATSAARSTLPRARTASSTAATRSPT